MISPNLDALKRIKLNRSSKDIAGDKGETKVYIKLNEYSRKHFYIARMIDNFIYRIPHGSREIDSIYIFKKGVFVIEIKNWKGVIKGTSKDEKWTRVLGNKTYPYKNPLIQNKNHVNDVKRMLGSNVPVHPLIIFTSENANSLKIPLVINLLDLESYLDKFNSSLTLSDKNIDDICKKLLEIKKRDAVSREAHIKNAKNTREYEAKKKYEADLPDLVKRVRAERNIK